VDQIPRILPQKTCTKRKIPIFAPLFKIRRAREGQYAMEDLIKLIEAEFIRTDYPEFKSGDTINVHVKIIEGNKERVQQFQGVCISRRGSGVSASFTVRKISNAIGVERTFPLYSPNIDKIEVIKRGDVRRAKLFYLRGLSGKSARIKERKA
jgi:large subunit ribosomal protein L19